MIDFTNKSLIKLKPEDKSKGYAAVKELLIDGKM